MADPIISIETIESQARAAAEADFKAGRTKPVCPYQQGTQYAKLWYAEYLMTECELHNAQGAGSRDHGKVERLEAA